MTALLVGFVVGDKIRTHDWEEVPLDRIRVSFVPQRDGRFAFGFSLDF